MGLSGAVDRDCCGCRKPAARRGRWWPHDECGAVALGPPGQYARCECRECEFGRRRLDTTVVD